MKKHIKTIKNLLVVSFVLFLTNACTNLDETFYSELGANNFYNNKTEVLQGALRPFTHMQAWLAPTGQNNYFYHNELSADQLAWPQKGRHGYDGGDHIRQHYHTWTSEEGRLQNTWRLMWTGVGYTNAAIEDISSLSADAVGMTETELSSILSELYVLRAFHYMKIMDLWGNVPVVTSVGKPLNPPTQTRAEVFDFVKTELETHVPNLSEYSQELIGRTSKTAGYAMLSELYLNAEKWVGTPMWDECIAASDKIINGEAGGLNGTPQLSDNLLDVFSNKNQTASENLYQVAYSRSGGFQFSWAAFFSGYGNMASALDISYSGWNAFVVIPTAFDAFDNNDLRKSEWFLFGPQYVYGTTDPIKATEEWNGQPLVYVNSIRRESEGNLTGEGGMDQGEENSGARFHKYKSGTKDESDYRENHYIMYRLTEIYFNKAEAIMRKNGGTANTEAVALINDSRKRAFSDADWASAQYTTATLTMDELLAERGREFVFEGKRRTDLIRFNKFISESWWDHQPSNDVTRELFPIPASQTANNPDLVQNEGY